MSLSTKILISLTKSKACCLDSGFILTTPVNSQGKEYEGNLSHIIFANLSLRPLLPLSTLYILSGLVKPIFSENSLTLPPTSLFIIVSNLLLLSILKKYIKKQKYKNLLYIRTIQRYKNN